MKRVLTISLLMGVLVACNQNNSSVLPDDQKAKALLQGVWIDEESGDVSFKAKGDTIYFADATSMPTYFRIYKDSLYLASGAAYGIVKRTEHLFWFNKVRVILQRIINKVRVILQRIINKVMVEFQAISVQGQREHKKC